MSQNGKGDSPRPKSVDYNTWSKNWDKIFKTKLTKESNNHGNRGKGTDKHKRP